jgi:hypothetical protein
LIRWLVDASVDCDHPRFSSVVKVSLEGVLVAARDAGDAVDARVLRRLPRTPMCR